MANGATLCPTMGRTHFSSARDVVSLLTFIWLADFSDASVACDPFFYVFNIIFISFIKMHKGRLTTYNANIANKINIV